MPFEILRADITKLDRRVDAIVNTANPRPVIGDGTDTAIHAAAGPQLLQAREKIGPIARGEAAVTKAYGLNARYVIHAVGPSWVDGSQGEEDTLRRTYDAALARIREKHCRSAAFPLLAAGSYGFPRDRALKIAIAAFTDFLPKYPMQLYLVVFNKEAFRISEQLFANVQSYIDDHYAREQELWERPNYGFGSSFGGFVTNPERAASEREVSFDSVNAAPTPPYGSNSCMAPQYNGFTLQAAPAFSQARTKHQTLEERLKNRGETFSEATLRIIDEHGWKDSEVYNRVFMDRRLFSKLRRKDYRPGRETAILMAFALRLNADEARDYIGLAGYTFSSGSKADIIVEYFLQAGNYDVIELDAALMEFGEPTLMKIPKGA